jgi:hypothetical protein
MAKHLKVLGQMQAWRVGGIKATAQTDSLDRALGGKDERSLVAEAKFYRVGLRGKQN